MKRVAWLLVALLLLPLAASAGSHHRYHGGHYHGGPRVGFWFGPGPLFWGPRWIAPPRRPYPYPYPYPYGYRERVVVVEEPSVYIERSAAGSPSSWWYYCESERAYYPDVPRCPGPWVRVAPQPE